MSMIEHVKNLFYFELLIIQIMTDAIFIVC